ncbi:sigma-70 family RNA polymerase sigma factor [Streptomyces sp. AA8]|uniref:Sigma-70 family RNA polymerase sigma factor n=3 Tax=Streptomyces telluris TaxID=2720021 RepID=A0A9X2LFS2_9ACTN|nr:sigma-70 family RNA polymerase sigma factor [Streptomyces telluris]
MAGGCRKHPRRPLHAIAFPGTYKGVERPGGGACVSPRGDHGAVPAELPAFAAFFTTEYPRVVHSLMRAGATYEEAEDAAQDAMQEFLRTSPGCKSPAGWVRTVAWHAYCKKAERNRRRLALESRSARLSGTVPPDRAEPDEHEQVLEILRGLPPRQGQVLALHLDGYSAQETAELLSVKASTVRSNLRHAITTLRSLLDNYEEQEGGPRVRKR